MIYYNDNDPRACAWLRELIAGGHLPSGDVDGRSIEDVRPKDLAGFDQCHFFAGIGGWPLALRWAGLEGVAGIWTGSCPCQPLSCAGKRQGHADERHLWPAFYRLIAECRPATVFGEQVASALGREWFAGVRLDLNDPAACARYIRGRTDYPRQILHMRAEIIKLAMDGVISAGKGADICNMNLVEFRELAASLHQATDLATVPQKEGR